MPMEWYFTQDGVPRGPVSVQGLDRMARSGVVDATTLIWRLGMREWQPITAQLSGIPVGVPFVARAPARVPPPRAGRKQPSNAVAIALCALGCPALIVALLSVFYHLGLHASDSSDPRATAMLQVAVAFALAVALFGSTLFTFAVTPRPAVRMFSLFYTLGGAFVLALLSVFAPPTLRIAAASTAMNDYGVVADDASASLRFGGRIGPGSAYKVQLALDAHPRIRRLVIDSPGGLIQQARRIADLVEQRHLTVVVHDECASACLVILMASPHRLADAGAVIGLHSPSAVASVNPYFASAGQNSADGYFQYLKAHGMSERLLGIARKTPANDVTVVDCVDLVNAGMLEGIYFRGRTFSHADANWRAISPLFKHS